MDAKTPFLSRNAVRHDSAPWRGEAEPGFGEVLGSKRVRFHGRMSEFVADWVRQGQRDLPRRWAGLSCVLGSRF